MGQQKPNKPLVSQQPPIRIHPEAMRLAEQWGEKLSWPKSKVVTECVLLVDDLIKGRENTRFLALMKRMEPEQLKADDQKTKLSPELEELIQGTVSEALKKVLENQGNPQLNEDPTPYKAKPKMRKA